MNYSMIELLASPIDIDIEVTRLHLKSTELCFIHRWILYMATDYNGKMFVRVVQLVRLN